MEPKSLFLNGLGRTLRHYRLVFLLFLASFLLAWVGTLPAKVAFGGVLDHSLAARKLVDGFDLPTYLELVNAPEISFNALVTSAMAPAFLFFCFLLFMVGGVITEYREERSLSRAELFGQGGAFFWRLLRLTLVSLIPFGLLGAGFGVLVAVYKKLQEHPSERLQDYVLMAGIVVLALLAQGVRMWFDLAQTRAVFRNEKGMFKNALRAFKLVSLRLYGSYLMICLARVAFIALLVRLWLNRPPAATGTSFLLLQAIVLVQIATRLWQRASAVARFEQEG